jgi:hypothetical protein
MEPNRDTGENGTVPNENNASTNQRNNRNVTDDPLQLLSSLPTPDLDGLHFPSIMHIMLRSVGEHHNHEQQEHIVSWQPHGRCFVVHRVHDFERLFLNR